MKHEDKWTIHRKGPKAFTTDTWRSERNKYWSGNVSRSQAIARLVSEAKDNGDTDTLNTLADLRASK